MDVSIATLPNPRPINCNNMETPDPLAKLLPGQQEMADLTENKAKHEQPPDYEHLASKPLVL